MDPASRPALADALGFSGEELAANRAGELSSRQLARLREARARQRARSGTRSRTLVITAAIVVVLVAAAVLPRLTGSHGKSSADVPFLVAAVILIALLMWRSAARAGNSASRIAGGAVSQAEGVAKTRRHGLGDASHGVAADPAAAADPTVSGGDVQARGELSIGGTRFLVTASVLEAFTDGRAYRAYYVGQGPHATIVSAEQI
jgi:hypothetical protein